MRKSEKILKEKNITPNFLKEIIKSSKNLKKKLIETDQKKVDTYFLQFLSYRS